MAGLRFGEKFIHFRKPRLTALLLTVGMSSVIARSRFASTHTFDRAGTSLGRALGQLLDDAMQQRFTALQTIAIGYRDVEAASQRFLR